MTVFYDTQKCESLYCVRHKMRVKDRPFSSSERRGREYGFDIDLWMRMW
jgi:hypothetical protein